MTAAEKLAIDDVASSELTTEQGARARLKHDKNGRERLQIIDPRGRLLFEYDAEGGRGMLVTTHGDMRLCAPQGAIELLAAQGISATSAGEIALNSDALAVSAKRSELRLGKTRAWADKLVATVDRAELRYGKLFRRAERVIEQAENVYQRVGELCELKAGRLRTLVSGHVWLKGKDVALNAKERVAIDGEHINLG